ncbi:MAG: glycosyltransferase family 2 protein [Flavobacteriales bacterium]
MRKDSIATTDIITLHFNKPQLTAHCIEKCLDISDEWRHMWIVDNGSDEPFVYTGPHAERITVLRSAENLGFSGGVNLGLQKVGAGPAQAALLLNNDAHPERGYISACESIAAAQPDLWGCAGIGCAPESEGTGSPVPIEAPRPMMRVAPYFPLEWDPNCDYPTKPFQVDWVTGAAMWISRAAWETLGPWDESFFLYCEDVDYCYRIRQAGGQVWCLPTIRYFHIRNASSDPHLQLGTYYAFRGFFRFFQKHNRMRLFGLFRWAFSTNAHVDRYSLYLRRAAFWDWICGQMGPVRPKRLQKLQRVFAKYSVQKD